MCRREREQVGCGLGEGTAILREGVAQWSNREVQLRVAPEVPRTAFFHSNLAWVVFCGGFLTLKVSAQRTGRKRLRCLTYDCFTEKTGHAFGSHLVHIAGWEGLISLRIVGALSKGSSEKLSSNLEPLSLWSEFALKMVWSPGYSGNTA